jgi:hypothetical protein
MVHCTENLYEKNYVTFFSILYILLLTCTGMKIKQIQSLCYVNPRDIENKGE